MYKWDMLKELRCTIKCRDKVNGKTRRYHMRWSDHSSAPAPWRLQRGSEHAAIALHKFSFHCILGESPLLPRWHEGRIYKDLVWSWRLQSTGLHEVHVGLKFNWKRQKLSGYQLALKPTARVCLHCCNTCLQFYSEFKYLNMSILVVSDCKSPFRTNMGKKECRLEWIFCPSKLFKLLAVNMKNYELKRLLNYFHVSTHRPWSHK